ncbi:MAG: hypothetical protein HY764_00260 [Candidatus Portnoybacteria bacterium]|nr:hypothetical protein [Candidatus Portnoybacteria bacterium]
MTEGICFENLVKCCGQEVPPALIIHCSNHLRQQQIDDFILHDLGIASFDRFAVPGGAQFFAAGGMQYKFKMTDTERCLFLITAHKIKRVICIAEAGCSWYESIHKEKATGDFLKGKQVNDLKIARQELNKILPEAEVQLFYAPYNDMGDLLFEEIV